METKRDLKAIKNAGVFVLVLFLIFDQWTGAGSLIDDYIYSAYINETIAGGVFRLLCVLGAWFVILELVNEVLHGKNKHQ